MQGGRNLASLRSIPDLSFTKNRRLLLLVSCLGLIVPSIATAEEVETVTVVPESVLVIGESVSVSTDQLAGSYDVIGRDELDYEHPDDTYELFNKAPGVYIARYNQGIINTDVAIRGFAGDGVTPHAKLLIDGIPFNLNNGYGELDQLFPLDIESIELYRGTSDARYGLFNLAGNYNVTSRRDAAKEVKVTAGSFGAKEVQGYAGFESDNLNHSYFLGYRDAGGYRDHTDVEKLEASGKWFYSVSDDTEVGLSVRHSTYDSDSPGYLTKEVARDKPSSSSDYSSEDGGDKTVSHYSVHVNTALSDSADWTTRIYFNDIERSRWVRFFEGSTLQNRIDEQKQTGIVTAVNWDINEQWSLNAGADWENQDVIEQRFNHPGQLRSSPAVLNRDRRYKLDTIGAFASIENTPSDFLRWNLGVRLDDIDGKRTDVAAEVDDFGTIVQPKANIFITPNDDLTLFANYGRSFQHFTGSAIYSAEDVSLHNGWEVGSKWFVNDAIELRVSYWEHEGKDEIMDLDGYQQIIGDTKRKGVDLGANIAATDKIDIWANYSQLDSEIVDPVASRANTKGNELRSIPGYTASLGVSYQATPALTARVHVDSQGDYYINENNVGGKYGGYTLVSAGFEHDSKIGTFNLQINNLFDEFYEYVYDFSDSATTTVHSPGNGINASLTYTMKF